jgi:hypothetical protein
VIFSGSKASTSFLKKRSKKLLDIGLRVLVCVGVKDQEFWRAALLPRGKRAPVGPGITFRVGPHLFKLDLGRRMPPLPYLSNGHFVGLTRDANKNDKWLFASIEMRGVKRVIDQGGSLNIRTFAT